MSPGPSSRGEPAETAQLKSTGGLSALSSNEVNFLVYRYLLESGFGHAAFTFGCESDVDRIDVEGKDVPVGALVSFIQKGFQMMEIEANLNASGSDVYGKYVQFSANDILTKDLDELRNIAKEMQTDTGELLEEGGKNVHGKEHGAPVDGKEHSNDVEEYCTGGGVLPPLQVKAVEEDGMDVDQPELHVEMKEEDSRNMFDSNEKETKLENGDIHQEKRLGEEGVSPKLEPLPPSPPKITD